MQVLRLCANYFERLPTISSGFEEVVLLCSAPVPNIHGLCALVAASLCTLQASWVLAAQRTCWRHGGWTRSRCGSGCQGQGGAARQGPWGMTNDKRDSRGLASTGVM
jgi:hypothetical protein